jgi:hypothetical protein
VYPTCWKCVPDGSEVTGHVGIFGHSSYTKSKRGSVEGKRLQASTFASVSGKEWSSIDSLGASSSDNSTRTGQSEYTDGICEHELKRKRSKQGVEQMLKFWLRGVFSSRLVRPREMKPSSLSRSGRIDKELLLHRAKRWTRCIQEIKHHAFALSGL